jgi:hypothetical protein
MLESKKYWNIESVHKDNITQCTVSCWIIGEQGNKVRVVMGGVIWLKQGMYMSEIPRWNPLEQSICT